MATTTSTFPRSSSRAARLAAGPLARFRFSTRSDGDLRVTAVPADLAERQRALVDRPWAWATQVHGPTVAVVGPEFVPGIDADALVTDRAGIVVSVTVADCAPIALTSAQPVVGAVHAGWRGLEAGVVEAAVAEMRGLGARDIEAWLGPCIHPECYEFGLADLAGLEDRYGPAVRGRTRDGQPALDLPTAVAAALGRAGVPLTGAADECTACDPRRYFSFRARRDDARHALAVWIDDERS